MDKEEELMKLIYISKNFNKTSKIIVIGFIFFLLSYLLNLILLFLWIFGYIFNVMIYALTTIFWIYGMLYVLILFVKMLVISRVVESKSLKRFMFLYGFSLLIFTSTFIISYYGHWNNFFGVFPNFEDFVYSSENLNGILTLFRSQCFFLTFGLVISGLIQVISWNDINIFLKEFPDNDVFVKKKDAIKKNRVYAILSLIPLINIICIPYIIKSMRVFNNPNEWSLKTSLTKTPENSKDIAQKCPKCGSIMAKNVEFCPECGNKINL